MDDLQHIGYSREVIEFVAVAKEFCGYLEGSHEEDASELLSKVHPANLLERQPTTLVRKR